VTGYDPQTRQYVRTEAQYLSSGKGAKFGDMQHPNRIGYKHTTVQSEEFADMFMAWSLGCLTLTFPAKQDVTT